MSLLRASFTVGSFTLLSRIFGFIRDILIARMIGASYLSDAFFVAFKLPNFMRRLFAEGAFNSAFVPLFAGTLASDGKAPAMRFAQEAMAVLIFILCILVACFVIFMPWLLYILAPGFADDPQKYELTVLLTRITFPYILLISLVSLIGAMLNSINRFAAVAATPILMNFTLIASLLFLNYYTTTPAHALAIGVTCSGIIQLGWLVGFAKKEGILPRLVRPALTENVKKLLRLIAPAALGAGVAQINLLIDVIIASTLPGAVSYLYYADRMNELPLGVIGIAVATALLPMLSKQIREGDLNVARHTLNRALELTLLLALPAALALITIAYPIITVMFERGEFGANDTQATYLALMAYATGLPAFVMIKVFAPGFFAHRDTKTPVKIATVCVLINLILNLTLIGPLAHVGLALATSIAGWVNACLMALVLYRRKHFAPDADFSRRTSRIILASTVMAAILYLIAPPLLPYFSENLFIKILALGTLVITGLITYGASILLLKVTTIDEIKSYLKRPGPPPAENP